MRVRGELGTGAVHLVLDDHVLMPRGPAVKVTPEVLDDLRAALTFTLEGYGELPADLPARPTDGIPTTAPEPTFPVASSHT